MTLLCCAPSDAHGVAELQPRVPLSPSLDPRQALGAIDLDPSRPGSNEAIQRRHRRFLARVVRG